MTKICSLCHQRKPADREHFVADTRKRDGLGGWCKSCFNEYRRAWRQGRPKPPRPPRPCLRCRADLPEASIGSHKRRLCDACRRALGRKGSVEGQTYADRLQGALGGEGLMASVLGSIVGHNLEAYVRLRVDVVTDDGVRSIQISDPLSFWDGHVDLVGAYARSVAKVTSTKPVAPNEIGTQLWEQSRGDPGWADLAAAVYGNWRRPVGRPRKKAPEATVQG